MNDILDNHKGRIKINFVLRKKYNLMLIALPTYVQKYTLSIRGKVAKSNYKICMSRRNIQSSHEKKRLTTKARVISLLL